MMSAHPTTPPHLIERLRQRRKSLGMTCATLSGRSGVPAVTVERVLSTRPYKASFNDVQAIAAALGMTVGLQEDTDAVEMLRHQAQAKAKRLVDLVQGTSLLEAQGVDEGQRRQMVEDATLELLRGSRRRLWESP